MVEKGGVYSLLHPDGRPFWSFGVCCTDPGTPWSSDDPKNPSYAAYRLFPNGEAWAKDTLGKLREWHFNSLGGWSEIDLFRKYGGDQRLPYFVVLHLGAYNKVPYNDLFSNDTKYWIDRAAKDQIEKYKDDPYLVGYFTDNELGWWDGYLFRLYLEMPATAPGKQRILQVLKRHYKNDFTRFKKDWITSARSFDELGKGVYLRPGGAGAEAVKAWMSEMGNYYYPLVKNAIRKYDKTRLIMGDRYCQYYNLQIAKASKGYVDVASTNFGADWTDGGISHFFLNTLFQASGKPVIVTEFYMCAMENRSGNKNSSGGFPIVQTQAERAAAFKKNVESLASLPYVVGAHWFQFFDEPMHGRGDGENYNMGLVDTAGKPYEAMIAAAKSINFDRLRRDAATEAHRPGAAGGSRERQRSWSDPMKGLKTWDREATFIPPSTPMPLADLYITQDKTSIYIGGIAMDYADDSLYENKKIPEQDRPAYTIKLTGYKSPIVVRYGGNKQRPTCSDPRAEITEVPALKHQIVIKLPRPKEPVLTLEAEWTAHSRAERVAWKTSLKNR